MNSHSKWLRTWAAELRKERVIGGANTAEQAADEIDRLETALKDIAVWQSDLADAKKVAAWALGVKS